MTADLMFRADQDDMESPERLEAMAAARDILTFLGIAVNGSIQAKVADRVMSATGATERRSYDLGWRHCLSALRE